MWSQDGNRLALLELYHSGKLRRRQRLDNVWKWLAELSWTRLSSRRDVLSVAAGCNAELEQLLTRIWPAWQEVRQQLIAENLPVTEQGWCRLRDIQRATELGALPPRLNRRTATALVAPHSKASLSRIRREALGNIDTTHDGLVRLRPNDGLIVCNQTLTIDASFLVDIAGEVVLTERALNGGTRLAGSYPKAVLLVENLGPYLDICPPDGWLVAHVPGWNTATFRLLLNQLSRVPLVHFGDLDPNGVRIAMHLRSVRSDIKWAIPQFWKEYVQKRGQRLTWPDSMRLDNAPPLVRELAKAGTWLEQESIVLDDRLCAALVDSLAQ